jgi:hypothetical protein
MAGRNPKNRSQSYACDPSTASNVWYKNSPIAQLAYTHGGQSWSSDGLYQSRVRKLTTTKAKPVRVIYVEPVRTENRVEWENRSWLTIFGLHPTPADTD